MTREQLGVLRDARDKLCGACSAVECETCYVPRLIEKHEREAAEDTHIAKGRWARGTKLISGPWLWTCSVCGKTRTFPEKFCPNCGAKMDKE